MSLDYPWFGASRLWLNEKEPLPNRYMAVRRVWECGRRIRHALLRVMADTDYIAWLDGVEIGRGQYSDSPESPTWSDWIIPEIGEGLHLLAFSVHYKGTSFSTYAPGIPGVMFALLADGAPLVVSDAEARVLPTPGFRSGEIAKVTPQLGFTMEFDARREVGDWRMPGYDDAAWQEPSVSAEERPMSERPAGARPRLGAFLEGKRVASGLIFRRHEESTPALTMMSDRWYRDHELNEGLLSIRLDQGDGWCLIYDLGKEAVGFMEMELDAPSGTVVDVAHGEHLDDGRVRAECFGRNFADRYICTDGRQVFRFPFRRIGGRFIELHILPSDRKASVNVHRVGVRVWELPLGTPCAFETPDARLLAVRKNAVRTLALCMHEHYEDCPWREQSLYTYDSRNQMLYGYYVWGNWAFAASNLRLFGKFQREDGHLRLCAPSGTKTVIPMFSTIWAVAMAEHQLYSGDTSVWLEERSKLLLMREKLMEHREPATGLYQAGSPDYWNFYEWAPGLDRVPADEYEVHSLYNLYLANMLEAMAAMEGVCGDSSTAGRWQAEADGIRRRVEEVFRDPSDGTYATFWSRGRLAARRHEHVQAMMLRSGVVPDERRGRLVELLAGRNGLVPVTLSAMPYLFDALLLQDNGPTGRAFMRRKLEENYYRMLDGDSTTLWETIKGGDDFFYAGSLCHGWSSLPVYYCGAGLLGVRPLAPGFRRFRVRPWSDGRPSASGDVPTPSGNIHVEWRRNASGLLDVAVRHPAGLTPVVEAFSDCPLGTVDVRQEA